MQPDDPSRTPQPIKEIEVFNKFKATANIAAAALAVLGLTACDPSTIEGKPTSTTERTVSAVDWSAPTSTIEIPKTDPYSSTGTWAVPSEIAPGNYRVTLQGTSGYYAVCADYACDIDFDGSDYTGMISNDFLRGPGFVTIPDHAVAIELRGVTLIQVG